MAVVRIPAEERTLRDAAEVARALATIGIDFSRVEIPADVTAAPADRVLAAYEREIAALKERGGYVTADVIDVRPDTPGLDAMLAKFSREHWHDEDEVRLIVSGRGIFHIRPKDGPVHAIRLFQDPCGWTPRYTESGAETGYQPVCLGPAYVRA